jgi:hypothetical protein
MPDSYHTCLFCERINHSGFKQRYMGRKSLMGISPERVEQYWLDPIERVPQDRSSAGRKTRDEWNLYIRSKRWWTRTVQALMLASTHRCRIACRLDPHIWFVSTPYQCSSALAAETTLGEGSEHDHARAAPPCMLNATTWIIKMIAMPMDSSPHAWCRLDLGVGEIKDGLGVGGRKGYGAGRRGV